MRACCGRCGGGCAGGQLEVPGDLVADDGDAVAGEEPDLEAALAAPPGALLRGRHVDNADHVAHLEGDLVRGLRRVALHGVGGGHGGRVDRAGVAVGHQQAPPAVVQFEPAQHRPAVDQVPRDGREAVQVVGQEARRCFLHQKFNDY